MKPKEALYDDFHNIWLLEPGCISSCSTSVNFEQMDYVSSLISGFRVPMRAQYSMESRCDCNDHVAVQQGKKPARKIHSRRVHPPEKKDRSSEERLVWYCGLNLNMPSTFSRAERNHSANQQPSDIEHFQRLIGSGYNLSCPTRDRTSTRQCQVGVVLLASHGDRRLHIGNLTHFL